VNVHQRYAEWPAHHSPRDSVACLWASRPSRTDTGRVLPDACLDIIWDGVSLFVAGPDTGPVPIAPAPGSGYAGLRFLPGRAPAFLGVPASDLLDARVPLADLWGQALADRLADRLAAVVSPEAAAGVLDAVVAERARTAPASDPIVDGLLGILGAGLTGTVPVSSGVAGNAAVYIASQVMSVGERRLYRHCRAAVGYGPKMLDRVLRFQRARRLAVGSGSLAMVAALAGYADQAHLTREARRLAGTTPSDLFKTAALSGS
jgi:helix-turn-helix protein/uncharacterized protein DUF6597